jgi:DNA-binding CsgD family transcriptional regulator
MTINQVSGTAQQLQSSGTTQTATTTIKPQNAQQQSDTAAAPKQDSVKLTPAALAKSLKQSGLSPKQIAQQMGLDIKTIDSYLNIDTGTTGSTQSATTSPSKATTVTSSTAAQASKSSS